MKTILVLFFLAVATNAQLDQAIQEHQKLGGIIDGLMNAALKKFLDKLPETIRLNDLNLTLPSEGLLSGAGELRDLEITGHKQLSFTKLSVSLFLELDFQLSLPSLSIYAKYASDVTIGDLIPIYGDGTINVHLNDILVNGSGKAHLLGLKVDDVRAGFTLGESTTFDLHGLLHNEAFSLIVSSVLNQNAAKFLNDNHDLISNVISPLVQDAINDALNGGKVQDYLAYEVANEM